MPADPILCTGSEDYDAGQQWACDSQGAARGLAGYHAAFPTMELR